MEQRIGLRRTESRLFLSSSPHAAQQVFVMEDIRKDEQKDMKGDSSGESCPSPGEGFRMPDRLRLVLRAFRYRNYRLFFLGQSLSLVGTWMQLVAVGWLVYRLTGSALQLGIVAFAGQISTLVLPPFAGLLADRMDRRHLLVWTQSLFLAQALLLSLLVLSGSVRVWQVALLSLLNGVINSFDMPARHSFVADLVPDREDLANAIPLNSAMFNSARLVGPSLAGVLISQFGEGVCFLINAVSYLAVLAALCAMRMPSAAPRKCDERRVLSEIREGFGYAWRSLPLRMILLLLCLLSLSVMPYTTLLPAFARDILHGTSRDYGFMITASGTGCLACNILFAARRNVIGLAGILPSASVAAAVFLVALSLCRGFSASFVILFFLGGITMAQLTASNVILQTVVDEDKRGRIMSLYIMAFIGMIPVGGLVAGAVAENVGVVPTMLGGACVCLVGSLVFLAGYSRFRSMLGTMYRSMGISGEKSGRDCEKDIS
jgi:MFS family permease